MHSAESILLTLQFGKLDFSITTTVIWLLLATLFAVIFVITASRKPEIIPKNKLQNILEIAVELIEKQILYPAGLTNKTWLPFILTIFLFILFNNWISIFPGARSTTGNLNVTGTLAMFVFVVATFSRFKLRGMFGSVKSLIPQGVKGPIALLLFPIELVSQLIKPFSLAIRLFANMTAGHLILLTFIGFTVLFKNIIISTLSVAGSVLISLFELFIGFIQAYIFAFLSALFISESTEEEH